MKSGIRILAILFALVISSVSFPQQVSAQQASVNFQIFYDQLSPYGQWVVYPRYGYVWIPDAGSDFAPYSTNGHWTMTNYGWAWVSDYDWGWAPFHYGRWDYDNYYGWLWIPDNAWGPSWVTWRRANGYYGWSPMGPGITISLSFGSRYNNQNDFWMFVRDRDIERTDLNRYYINRSDHDQIFRASTVINRTYIDNSRHTTYVSGPAREDVQRVTGRTISPVIIRERATPGQEMNKGELRMYRPQVKANNISSQKAAPSRVFSLKEVKRPAQPSQLSQSSQPSQPAQFFRMPQTVQPMRASQPQRPTLSQENGKQQQPPQQQQPRQPRQQQQQQPQQPRQQQQQTRTQPQPQQKSTPPATTSNRAQPSQPLPAQKSKEVQSNRRN